MTTTADRTEISFLGIAGTSSKMEPPHCNSSEMPKRYGFQKIIVSGSNRSTVPN
jgi:hypothetical protein